MSEGLSRKKEILLFRALKQGGTISTKTANRLYSGNNGKDALISLEFEGYLENQGFGNFKVIRVPGSVKERYKAFKEDKEQRSTDDEVNLESKEYEVKQTTT